MSAARAVQNLTGSYGQFLSGAPIVGVPDEIVATWVRDRAAVYETPQHPEAELMETATAPASEAAIRRPAGRPQQRRSPGVHPAERRG